MKKIIAVVAVLLSAIISLSAQTLSQTDRNFLYVNTTVDSKEFINALSQNFSVDGYTFDERSGIYTVRVALARWEYAAFEALGLPYEILTPSRPASSMVATTMSEMLNWNKYPSYEIYTQLMADFQASHPDICRIDTILAATPNPSRPHALLAAHISASLGQETTKPAFLYSSTMHGDEVVGFYMMLRLIDYILNNATTDPTVQQILQNVDLWICPLENPDGTYISANDQISSYSSQRYNYNNIDLNRNYPFIPGISGSANVQPETQAMINFVSGKHFVMSANFHGGAELANFPWDSYTSNGRRHPDDDWFRYISWNYVNACQAQSSSYMTGNGGSGVGAVTEGGDWYVIGGSRQDYMNYYQHCREITLEISYNKVVTSTSSLPTFWTNSKNALLGYIMECLNGFHGVVTDAVTGEPVEATIFVQNHDTYNSEVYSHLPTGKYHRPIKGGTYTIEVSADCYQTQTFTITTTDGAGVVRDIQLQPLVAMPTAEDQHIRPGESATFTAASNNEIRWYDSEAATAPIAVGGTFTTPVLTETATYYLEEVALQNGVECRSARSSVQAIIDEVEIAYGYMSVTACGSYTYEGNFYTTSDNYHILYPNASSVGGDSVLILSLTIHPTYEENIPIFVEQGETYTIGEDTYTAVSAGIYTYDRLFQTIHGCDSVCHYSVYVTSLDLVYGDMAAEGCGSFTYEGQTMFASGDYPFFYPAQAHNGADSILMLHLTLHPVFDTTVNVELEIGDTFQFGDETFEAVTAAMFLRTAHLQSVHGCDSTVHYVIDVRNPLSIREGGSGYAVYPNPTGSHCWIERTSDGKTADILVFSASGQLVATEKASGQRTKLDVSGLRDGVYFIRIVEEGREATTLKIVKQ